MRAKVFGSSFLFVNLRCKLLKFADDVKLIGQVASERDVDSLRADLQLLAEWSEDCLLYTSPSPRD